MPFTHLSSLKSFKFLRSAAGALLLGLVSCSKSPSPPSADLPEKLLIPEQGAYTGECIDFGDTEDDVTVATIEGFEKLVGKY